jgi:hypothetical protein
MAGGQQSDFGQGSLGNSTLSIRLRSKKDGSGSASFELTGSQITSAQESPTRGVTRALSGSVVPFASGTITPSGSTSTVSNKLLVGERAFTGLAPADCPSYDLSSRSFYWSWENAGGDWSDLNGSNQGSTPFATATITQSLAGQAITWSGGGFTALIQKLVTDGNTGIYLKPASGTSSAFATKEHATSALRPSFQIVTNTGTFNVSALRDVWLVNPTQSNPDGGVSTEMRQPFIVKPDLTTVTGVILSASMTLYTLASSQSVPCTVGAYYLRMPVLIYDPATQLGGTTTGLTATMTLDTELASNASVVFYPSFLNQAAVEAAGWSNVDFNAGKPESGGFIPVPEYGINLLRIRSRYPGHPFSDGQTILSWRRLFTDGLYQELYVRYLMKIDTAIYSGMNEGGVKLPGFEGSSLGGFSYRMEHLAQSEVNQNLYSYWVHAYDATHPVGSGAAENRQVGNIALQAGRTLPYCIEQRVKLNTEVGGVWQSNGIIQIWVDDVLSYSDTTRKIVDVDNEDYIDNFFANFYHGGFGNTPTSQFYYDFGGVCVATQRIGRPPLVSSLPYTVPAAGVTKQIALNTAEEFCPPAWTASGEAAKWPECLWREFGTGGGLVEDYSEHGAFVIANTGGHQAPTNVGGFAFDFSTARFEILTPQNTGYTWYRQTDYFLAETSGSPWFEITGSGGIPTPPHPYDDAVVLPTASGGGTKGSIVYPKRMAITQTSEECYRSHRFDLDSKLWSRFSTDSVGNAARAGSIDFNGSCVLDDTRNVIWVTHGANDLRDMQYLDLSDGLYKLTAQSTFFPSSDVAVGYMFMFQGLIFKQAANGSEGRLYCYDADDTTTGWFRITTSGTTLPTEGTANKWAYVPSKDKFYKLPYGGGTSMFRLTPPSGWQGTPSLLKSGTWVCDTVSISPSVPASAPPGHTQSRFFYVPALGCLAWIPGNTGDGVYLIGAV